MRVLVLGANGLLGSNVVAVAVARGWNVFGTYHVACRTCVTTYRFGEVLRRRLGAAEGLLEEASLSELDRSADRPGYTCLDVETIETDLGMWHPTLADDLDALQPVP